MTAVCGATGSIASKAQSVPMQIRNTTWTERLELWIPEVVSYRGPSRPILLSGVWPRRQLAVVEKMEWGIPVAPLTQAASASDERDDKHIFCKLPVRRPMSFLSIFPSPYGAPVKPSCLFL